MSKLKKKCSLGRGEILGNGKSYRSENGKISVSVGDSENGSGVKEFSSDKDN